MTESTLVVSVSTYGHHIIAACFRCWFQQSGGSKPGDCPFPHLWRSQCLWFWQNIPTAGEHGNITRKGYVQDI